MSGAFADDYPLAVNLDRIYRESGGYTRDAIKALYDAILNERAQRLTREFTVQPVPFNANDFTGSGSMTWTLTSGDIGGFWAQRVGVDRLRISFGLYTGTTGGVASASLRFQIPFGHTLVAGQEEVNPIFIRTTAGGEEIGYAYARPGTSTTQILLQRLGGVNWPLETNTITVAGQITIPIQV